MLVPVIWACCGYGWTPIGATHRRWPPVVGWTLSPPSHPCPLGLAVGMTQGDSLYQWLFICDFFILYMRLFFPTESDLYIIFHMSWHAQLLSLVWKFVMIWYLECQHQNNNIIQNPHHFVSTKRGETTDLMPFPQRAWAMHEKLKILHHDSQCWSWIICVTI